jgi:hypothetical protein
VGDENVLKPALRLITYYRLVIEEIKDDEAITSYTQWVDAFQVRGVENQEVYVTFNSRFERIWLESRKLSRITFPRNLPISDSEVSTPSVYTVGRKNTSRSERSASLWSNFEKCSGWSWLKMQMEISSKRFRSQCGRTPSREGVG